MSAVAEPHMMVEPLLHQHGQAQTFTLFDAIRLGFELNSPVDQQQLLGQSRPRRARRVRDGGVSMRLEWSICEHGAGKRGHRE